MCIYHHTEALLKIRKVANISFKKTPLFLEQPNISHQLLLGAFLLFFNSSIEKEINYVRILNGALPEDIRVYCWAPVDTEKSARFDCIQRIYRYFFPM
jgi:hypothetical protein